MFHSCDRRPPLDEPAFSRSSEGSAPPSCFFLPPPSSGSGAPSPSPCTSSSLATSMMWSSGAVGTTSATAGGPSPAPMSFCWFLFLRLRPPITVVPSPVTGEPGGLEAGWLRARDDDGPRSLSRVLGAPCFREDPRPRPPCIVPAAQSTR